MFESTNIIKYEVFIFLYGLIILLIYKIIKKQIDLSQLLYKKGTRKISPVRLQKVVFTIVIALYILVMINKDPTKFPEIPITLIMLMGGSSLAYLGVKAKDLLKIFSKDSLLKSKK